MLQTCIREYSNKVVKYLCAEVRADMLGDGRGNHDYRFTSIDDVRKLVEISGINMNIVLDYRHGYVYLTCATPSSAPRYTSVAMPGEMFLLDLATREFSSVSRSHFEMHYRVLDRI